MNRGPSPSFDEEQRLPVFDRLSVLHEDRLDRSGDVGLDLVQQLHRLDDADGLPLGYRLADFGEPTPFGIDREPTAGPSPAESHAEEQLLLPAATTSALHEFARANRLTLNTLVQGAWALLLGRYSESDDVVFGVTVSGRPTSLEGAESIIGLFINTLPLRMRISKDDSLLLWLKALQEQQAEIRQYEYTPLIQVQGWSELLRRAPLFETMLVFNNYPVDEYLQEQTKNLGLQGYHSISWLTVYSNYPLIIVTGPSRQLMLRFVYDCTSFTDDTIARIIEELRTLLLSMVDWPEQRLSDLQVTRKGVPSNLPVSAGIHIGDQLEHFNFEL